MTTNDKPQPEVMDCTLEHLAAAARHAELNHGKHGLVDTVFENGMMGEAATHLWGDPTIGYLEVPTRNDGTVDPRWRDAIEKAKEKNNKLDRKTPNGSLGPKIVFSPRIAPEWRQHAQYPYCDKRSCATIIDNTLSEIREVFGNASINPMLVVPCVVRRNVFGYHDRVVGNSGHIYGKVPLEMVAVTKLIVAKIVATIGDRTQFTVENGSDFDFAEFGYTPPNLHDIHYAAIRGGAKIIHSANVPQEQPWMWQRRHWAGVRDLRKEFEDIIIGLRIRGPVHDMGTWRLDEELRAMDEKEIQRPEIVSSARIVTVDTRGCLTNRRPDSFNDEIPWQPDANDFFNNFRDIIGGKKDEFWGPRN